MATKRSGVPSDGALRRRAAAQVRRERRAIQESVDVAYETGEGVLVAYTYDPRTGKHRVAEVQYAQDRDQGEAPAPPDYQAGTLTAEEARENLLGVARTASSSLTSLGDIQRIAEAYGSAMLTLDRAQMDAFRRIVEPNTFRRIHRATPPRGSFGVQEPLDRLRLDIETSGGPSNEDSVARMPGENEEVEGEGDEFSFMEDHEEAISSTAAIPPAQVYEVGGVRIQHSQETEAVLRSMGLWIHRHRLDEEATHEQKWALLLFANDVLQQENVPAPVMATFRNRAITRMELAAEEAQPAASPGRRIRLRRKEK